MREEFLIWLQDEMNVRGLDQAQFAKRADITPAQVSRVMAGTRNAGPDFLRGTAKALRMPEVDVFRRAGFTDSAPGEPLPPELHEWGRRLQRLTTEDRAALIRIFDQMLSALERQQRNQEKAER